MNNLVNLELDPMEGRTFILGREGHIYIGDPSVSKQHAELKIIDGRIHIRDLDSTNGIYLITDNKPVRFQQGFVEPDQIISIGYQREKVKSLLAIIGVFAE